MGQGPKGQGGRGGTPELISANEKPKKTGPLSPAGKQEIVHHSRPARPRRAGGWAAPGLVQARVPVRSTSRRVVICIWGAVCLCVQSAFSRGDLSQRE